MQRGLMKGQGKGAKESGAYNPTYKCGCNNNNRVEGYGGIHYDNGGLYAICTTAARKVKREWATGERGYAQNIANG